VYLYPTLLLQLAEQQGVAGAQPAGGPAAWKRKLGFARFSERNGALW